MTGIDALALLFQFLVPAGLIVPVALARQSSRLSWFADVALAMTYTVLIALAGLWLVLPWRLPSVFLLLLAVAVAFRFPRAGRGRRDETVSSRVRVGLKLVLAVAFAGLCLVALDGRRPPGGDRVDLGMPLEGGTYLIANGGSNRLVNFHLETFGGETFRAWRGQSFGVDLVAVGAWGSRSAGPFPDSPDGYAIFGDPVLAPCGGTVVAAVDGQADRRPGESAETLEGNHVILACGDSWVVLAHLMSGSVRVESGQDIAAGEVLGAVGNSGASGEPHLHIHAQAPGTPGALLGGEPRPVTFGGQYLVRNYRVR